MKFGVERLAKRKDSFQLIRFGHENLSDETMTISGRFDLSKKAYNYAVLSHDSGVDLRHKDLVFFTLDQLEDITEQFPQDEFNLLLEIIGKIVLSE